MLLIAHVVDCIEIMFACKHYKCSLQLTSFFEIRTDKKAMMSWLLHHFTDQ